MSAVTGGTTAEDGTATAGAHVAATAATSAPAGGPDPAVGVGAPDRGRRTRRPGIASRAMGLFDRFRPADVPSPVPAVGVETFSDLRSLVRRGASTAEQRASIAAVLEAHRVPAAAITRLTDSMRDGVALFEAGAPVPAPPCRLGGSPLLPAGTSWPTDRAGRPLSFIAAVDLATVPALAPLPAAGTLVVYWDHAFAELDAMDFVDATRVFLVPPGEALVTATTPEGAQVFGPIVLDPVVMPYPGDPDALQGDDVPADVPGYELQDALMQEFPHQLLGASRDVQGPVLDEVPYWFEQGFPETRERYAADELRGEDWSLLAQIDGTVGLEFGDAGSLYLVLPTADLLAGRVDRVMGIMQCF